MFEKFRARRIMAKHTAFEVGIDRVLNASWHDVQRGSPDAEVKGFVAVFSFCIMNAFETLRIFGSQRVEVAKLLHGTVGDKTAVEIALLGIARASLDEDLSDDFTEVVAVAHMILTKVGALRHIPQCLTKISSTTSCRCRTLMLPKPFPYLRREFQKASRKCPNLWRGCLRLRWQCRQLPRAHGMPKVLSNSFDKRSTAKNDRTEGHSTSLHVRVIVSSLSLRPKGRFQGPICHG